MTPEASRHYVRDSKLWQTQVGPGPHFLSLVCNMKTSVFGQYSGYNFNSFGKLGEFTLGVNEHGIFSLDDGDTDNGAHVSVIIEFPTTDFDVENLKRIRYIYIGGRVDGTLRVKAKIDNGSWEYYDLEFPPGVTSVESGRVALKRVWNGRYVEIGIENRMGCDFSLNTVTAALILLGRRPQSVS